MKVLAIDPGSMLGWATDATGRLEWGTEDFRIKNGESSGNRWMRFNRWLDEVAMRQSPTRMLLGSQGGRTVEMAWEPTVDLIVYERSVFMPRARAAAEIAAGFTTRLEEFCEAHGIALQPVGVQTLKSFAIPKVKRKKGDPKMDRSKNAMIRAAALRIVENPVSVPTRSHAAGLTEHEADALWLYWWAKENAVHSGKGGT